MKSGRVGENGVSSNSRPGQHPGSAPGTPNLAATVPGVLEKLAALKKGSLSEQIRQSHSQTSLNVHYVEPAPPRSPGVQSLGAAHSFPRLPLNRDSFSLGGDDSGAGTDEESSKARHRVNFAALLNDPRPGRRYQSSTIFSKLYGEHFQLAATTAPPSADKPTLKLFENYAKSVLSHVQPKEASYEQAQRVPQPQQSLTRIPPIFLNSEYTLKDEDTFHQVLPWLSDIDQSAGHLVRSSKLQRDKLEHFLELVEADIVAQISSRSDAFFASMSSHDALQNFLVHICAAIRQLRLRLKEVRHLHVDRAVKILQLQRRRQRLVHLRRKLELVRTVRQTKPTVQVLLHGQEFAGALDLIQTTTEVLQQELPDLRAFRHLPSELTESEKTIERLITAELSSALSCELMRPFNSPTDTSLAVEVAEEGRLIAIMLGHIRLANSKFVEQVREECQLAVKATMKEVLNEHLSSAEPPTSSTSRTRELSDLLRPLTNQMWTELVSQLCHRCREMLTRVHSIYQTMLELVTASSAGAASAELEMLSPRGNRALSVTMEDAALLSDTDYIRLKARLKEMLVTVVEFTQERLIKVVSARSKSSGSGSLAEFLTQLSQVDQFAFYCSQITNSPNKLWPIKAYSQCQVSSFVSAFHEERKNKLSEVLESEQWRPLPVPAYYQALVTHISERGELERPPSPALNGFSSETSAVLWRGTEEFNVASVSLTLLDIVTQYADAANQLPSAAGDLGLRLMEILKLFNSRTCQLVIGQGVVHLLGFQAISVKHMAVTARSLELVSSYFSLISDFFISRSTDRQRDTVEKHLLQVATDYSEHVKYLDRQMLSVILGKLVEQLGEWRLKPPIPSPQFKTICDSVQRFTSSLATGLGKEHLERLVAAMNTTLRERIVKTLSNTSMTPPLQMLLSQELAFYNRTLRELKMSDSITVRELLEMMKAAS